MMKKKLLRNTCARALVCFLASLLLVDPAHAGATITVINNDGAGEGFNDPSPPDPASTAGGNPGATLGAQRLNAFQFAADLWGNIINSIVEIRVDATLDPLFCNAFSAVLGSTTPNTVHRDFAGAPVASTWYVQALANARNGADLAPGFNDIAAQFNSTLGTTCPNPFGWYYGLDGSPPPSTFDFPTVVLHEIAHGLGFLSLVNLGTGAKFLGFDDAYMRLLEDHTTGVLYPSMTNAERVTASTNTGNLHWTGAEAISCGNTLTAGRDPATGHIEMFAPNPAQGGSSVSHVSTTLSPNQLMEPFNPGPLVVPEIAPCLLVDLMAPPPPPPPPPPPAVTCRGLPATIVGTAGADVLTGTTGPDVIAGLGANDRISGLGGNDRICGGGGNDVLSGSSGKDRLYGDAGKDRLSGGRGNDRLEGGTGNDTLKAGSGTDTCKGGSGTDTASSCERVTGVR